MPVIRGYRKLGGEGIWGNRDIPINRDLCSSTEKLEKNYWTGIDRIKTEFASAIRAHSSVWLPGGSRFNFKSVHPFVHSFINSFNQSFIYLFSFDL